MPQVLINEGRHLTADEYVNGRLVRRGQLYLKGETIPSVQASEHVELKKDTARFTDKGKS